jgi:GAF domain-containing protein
VSVLVAFAMLFLFNGFADNILSGQVADTGHLRDVAQYLPAVDEIQDEATLLARTIDIVRDDMKYPVTQIYLLDEERKVSRRMSSGLGKRETGMVINLREADARVISDVTRLRQPITVSRKSERGAYIVPPAQIAVALPVMHHDEILAVMDVQTTNTEFADNEITTLMLMAQQLGVSLAHLRRVKDLETLVRDQEESTRRLQLQLQAMRKAGDQTIAQGWSNFFQGQGRALGYDLKRALTENGEPELIAANALTPAMRQAMEQGDIHIEMSPLNQQTLNVPIVFRGQMLGAMAFTLARGITLSERQLEMTRVIADRLAVALENTRLFENSQEQVRREQKATEAAGAMMSANDVKSVLNLAAQTFNQALGAVYTGIHLQPGVLTDAVTSSHRPEEGTNPA